MSGGIDSMVLLYILKQLSVKVIVAHVNYGTRSGDSVRDQQLVENYTNKYGYRFELLKPEYQENKNGNFQEWARDIRYCFFRDLKSQYEAEVIATAHHRDDQIETILMKLLRGAGLASWGGMEVISADLFRPLLSVSKRALIDFANQHNIKYRQDHTNLKRKYARNLIRLELVEQFDELLPGWRNNVLALPEKAKQFKSALQALVDQAVVTDYKLNFDTLSGFNPPLRRSVILEYIKQKAPHKQITKSALHQLDTLERLQTGQRVQLSKSVSLFRDRQLLIIDLDEMDVKPQDTHVNFVVNKEDKDVSICLENGIITIKKQRYQNPDFENYLYLDVDTIPYPLTIRPWNHGDRFQPFGMQGHQLISDHLTNRKIPSSKRHLVFVAETFDQTICAVIFPKSENEKYQPGSINHKHRCTTTTELCLKIIRQSLTGSQKK